MVENALPGLCRDCGRRVGAGPTRCPGCGSPRLVRHSELFALSIAHMDCDAFYAAVEKRDNPDLRDRPLIVGGDGGRSVVATCCYIARTAGVRSAMPMGQARRLCPDAVVVPPHMAKYREASGQIRAMLDALTPLVEPLSLDEAFLDLSGTLRLHGRSPAELLVALARRIEGEVGVTVSIGLSYNKFLAKVASDLHKPRGFTVIGAAEAVEFLKPRPVETIWGVGKALRTKLAADGISRIGQLQTMDESDLIRRYGSMGQRLFRFARGIDGRKVEPFSPAKSISTEETFSRDLVEPDQLAAALWRLCEELSARLKRKDQAGQTVVLKLRTAAFQLKTRSERLEAPTQLASMLFRIGHHLLAKEPPGVAYRLIGIGVSELAPGASADPPDLDQERERARRAEAAIDRIRAKFGRGAIGTGRGRIA